MTEAVVKNGSGGGTEDAIGSNALDRIFKEVNGENWYQEILGWYIDGYSVDKLDVFKAEPEIPRSDRYTAEKIASKFRNRVSYVLGTKEWHIWDVRIHRKLTGDGVAKLMVNMYGDQLKKALDEIKYRYEMQADVENASETDSVVRNKNKAEAKKRYETVFKEHRRYRNQLDSTNGSRNVVEQLKDYLAVAEDYYDNDRDWFVMKNYVVDVRESWRTGELKLALHDPSRPVFRYIDADYNPEAEHVALDRFLGTSIADESQAWFLQKALGSALIGAPEKTKTIIDAFGAPDSGKSMLNGVLRALAPEYCITASPNAVMKAGPTGGKEADMARDDMRLGRIISFSEVKRKLDKDFILQYTGGDELTTTRKYRNAIKWVAQGMMIMMSNEGMNIGSQEQAVSDRIKRIHFPHSFRVGSEDPRYEKDATLKDQIIAEREGFLVWLLQGFIGHLTEDAGRDGETKASDSMEMLKMEMQDNTNTAAIFWESVAMNKYEKDLSAPKAKWVPLVTMIADYRKWCKMTEHPQMDEADVKAWMKREELFERASGMLRLSGMVAKQGAVIGG